MKKLMISLAALTLFTSIANAGSLYEIPNKGSPLEGVQKRPHTKNTVVVTNNYGGLLNEFFDQREQWDKNNTHIEIKGECVSACTLYTAAKNVCIHDGAFLKFHQPQLKLAGNPKTEQMHPDIERLNNVIGMYLDAIAPDLKVFIIYNWLYFPTSASRAYLVLTSDDVISSGWMKRCKPLPKDFKLEFNSETYFYSFW